jgi:hypothetical protein
MDFDPYAVVYCAYFYLVVVFIAATGAMWIRRIDPIVRLVLSKYLTSKPFPLAGNINRLTSSRVPIMLLRR